MNFDDLKTPGKTIGWDFIVLMSRQGKIRLAEFFSSYTESDKRRILRDIAADVLPRAPKMCNIIEVFAQYAAWRLDVARCATSPKSSMLNLLRDG